MVAQNKEAYSTKPSLSRFFLGTAKAYDSSDVRRQPDKCKHLTASQCATDRSSVVTMVTVGKNRVTGWPFSDGRNFRYERISCVVRRGRNT